MPRWHCPDRRLVPLVHLDAKEDANLGSAGFYKVDDAIGGFIGALQPPHGSWVRIGDFEALSRGNLLRHIGIFALTTQNLESPSLRIPDKLVPLIGVGNKRPLDLADLPDDCLEAIVYSDLRRDGNDSLLWFHRMWLTLGLSHHATSYSSAEEWNSALATLAALGFVWLAVGLRQCDSYEEEWDVFEGVYANLPWMIGALKPEFLDDETQDETPRRLIQDRIAHLIDDAKRSVISQLGRHYLRIDDAYDEIRLSFSGRAVSSIQDDIEWEVFADGPRPAGYYAGDFVAEGELGNFFGPTAKQKRAGH